MDIKITHVRPVGDIRKVPDRFGRKASEWALDVMYTLETGCPFGPEQAGTMRFSRKRDAIAQQGTMPRDVDNMRAMFDGDGRFYGTSTSYRLFS